MGPFVRMTPVHRKRAVRSLRVPVAMLAIALSAGSASALAQGRLLATGGVTQVEGAAGGGLVPWALIAGYGTRDEIGFTATYTQVELDDFRLRTVSAAMGWSDRVEVSVARQRLGLGSTVPGRSIQQDIVGLKVRAIGDAVFDADRWLPQIAFGAQYKHNRDFDVVPKALGARRAAGLDLYATATKLFFAGPAGRNLLLAATLRATKANQLGLLGFGGDLSDRYRVVFEGSAALFVTDRVAVGYEVRQKPNNLGAFREDRWQDVFVAWVPNKRIALTAAWVGLGTIADKRRQAGVYLSAQAGF